jgi:hypothetical protein
MFAIHDLARIEQDGKSLPFASCQHHSANIAITSISSLLDAVPLHSVTCQPPNAQKEFEDLNHARAQGFFSKRETSTGENSFASPQFSFETRFHWTKKACAKKACAGLR